MKIISNISEKTGLQENMILGILFIFLSVVLYFIYIKMNKKKENFSSHRTVKELINKKSTRQDIDDALKDYCNANGTACTNYFNSGNDSNCPANCTECFDKCDTSFSGDNQKKWCKIGCNQKYNTDDLDGICPTKIADIS